MKHRILKVISVALLLIVMGTACKRPDEKAAKINNYNLAKPEKFTMPESLLEISGITFHSGSKDTIYAINDEEGRLFRLNWGVKKQYNAKFGKKGDYEDVAILNGKVVVLKSNGHLFIFPLAEANDEEVVDVKEFADLLPKGEYEGAYGDEATGKLYVICKNCDTDDPKKSVTGYIFQIGDAVYPVGNFQIDVDAIKSLTGKVKRGFQPAGMAKNPITHDWYIVSGLNKLMVVTDSSWKIKETVPLNGNTFNQPEGVTFDPEGNLYISNEGDDISDGNILKFKRLAN